MKGDGERKHHHKLTVSVRGHSLSNNQNHRRLSLLPDVPEELLLLYFIILSSFLIHISVKAFSLLRRPVFGLWIEFVHFVDDDKLLPIIL